MGIQSLSSITHAGQKSGSGMRAVGAADSSKAVTSKSASSWTDIASRIQSYTTRITPQASGTSTVNQLQDLLKVQIDVSKYQLRVEMMTKVAESALASMRKLQQTN